MVFLLNFSIALIGASLMLEKYFLDFSRNSISRSGLYLIVLHDKLFMFKPLLKSGGLSLSQQIIIVYAVQSRL